MAYLTQTTLAVDETADIVDGSAQRYPALVGPPRRRHLLRHPEPPGRGRAIAAECDLVLVVGSRNSSNSNRLVEVARRHGCRADLVEDETELDLAALARRRTDGGLTAGASLPPSWSTAWSTPCGRSVPSTVEERAVTTEHVPFSLPLEVR